jgi:transaldolase
VIPRVVFAIVVLLGLFNSFTYCARDHCQPRASLTEDLDSANKTMETVAKLGISMKEVTDKLTDDGVRLFAEAFDKLLEVVEKS